MAIGGAGLLVVALGAQAKHASMSSERAESSVDSGGNLHVPHDYRTTFQFLGSWAVYADQGKGAKELHVVYASPASRAWRSAKEFINADYQRL